MSIESIRKRLEAATRVGPIRPPAPNAGYWMPDEAEADLITHASTDLALLLAVAEAATHQRDTSPGAQPQLLAALDALEAGS